MLKTVLYSCIIASFLSLLTIIDNPLQAADSSTHAPDAQKADVHQQGQTGEAATSMTDTQNSSQKNGQTSWSDAARGKTSNGTSLPQGDPRESALQGSPETGYAGTWTDPATGDIITSVIAPTPRPDSYQSTPIIVEPQIAPSWGGYSNSGWQQNSWPVTPDSPGYPDPGFQQPPSAGGPGFNPNQWGSGYYPPQGGNYNPGFKPPQNFNPNYRPLRPQPGHPQQPPQNGAIWQPNRPVYPSEGGAMPPQPEYNIPGWKPFPPENNQAVPPYGRPPQAGFQPQPEYNIPGWKPFPPENNRYPTPRPQPEGYGPRPPQPRGF